jgi:two-component system, OmpR family, KDP operon response regulator KdpE
VTRVETDGLTVELVARTATRDGHDIRLSPAERHPLEILITSPGRLVPQEDLPREVWGPPQGDRTPCVRVYMARLRRKLEADPSRPRHLVTEPGAGYRFET